MAQAFRPSRSAIYGSPEREAMVGIGNTLLGQLQDWSNEEIQADYIQQTSAGGLAFLKERTAFLRSMQDGFGDRPDDWATEWAKRKEPIRNAVLKGVRSPRAKQALGIQLDEEFAQLEFDLENEASKQRAKNLHTNFEVQRAELLRPHEYRGESDLMARIGQGLTLIRSYQNTGGMPGHPDVSTPEAAAAQEDQLVRQMAGDYLLQEALRTGDDGAIDMGNELAESILGRPVFELQEQTELKKRYKDATGAAKAETEKARREQAAAANVEFTNRGMAGQFSRVDDTGRTVTLIEEVQAFPHFSGPEKREVASFVRGMMTAYGQGKEYDPVQKVEAYNEIASESDPEKRMGLIKRHAGGLGWSQVKPFIDDLRNPKAPENSTATAALSGYVSAVRSMRTATIKEDEKTFQTDDDRAAALARMNSDLARRQNEVLQHWKENPDLTPQQRLDAMDTILAPIKDEAAKEQVKGIFDIFTVGWQKQPPAVVGGFGGAAAVPRKSDPAPAGLETVWAKLSAEERASAQRLIAGGMSINRILEKLK
jgi:hypothetical protein